MKSIVFYKSISGYTEKYAKWISEELDCTSHPIESIKKMDLSKYKNIIFGGSLHAVGINGLNLFIEHLPTVYNQKIFIFTVGASPEKDYIIEEIRKNNFKNTSLLNIPLYYFRGGYSFKKLDFYNKILMFLLNIKLKLTKNRNEDQEGMLQAYKKPIDFTKKERISNLIKDIKNSNAH